MSESKLNHPGNEEYLDELLQSFYDRGFSDAVNHRYGLTNRHEGFITWKNGLHYRLRHRYDVLTGKVSGIFASR